MSSAMSRRSHRAILDGISHSAMFPPVNAAKKVNSKRLLLAQALLPVRVLPRFSSMQSQERLCCPTFSAARKCGRHTQHDSRRGH